MLGIIYTTLSLALFLVAGVLIYSRVLYLNKHPDHYNSSYNGHEKFLDFIINIIKFALKKIYSLIKIAYQNILHFWVRLISKISTFSEKLYTESRNKFVTEVVRDKKSVPHFWSHLKKYKREIDEEREETIEAISSSSSINTDN